MDDLTAFVKARLDEDEAAAKANIGPGETDGLGDTEGGGPCWPDYQTFDGPAIDAASDYLNRFRPLRMLREVTAKRAILVQHETRTKGEGHDGQPRCHVCTAVAYGHAMRFAAPCPTLRHLAAIWSDHPDYRAEWAPGN